MVLINRKAASITALYLLSAISGMTTSGLRCSYVKMVHPTVNVVGEDSIYGRLRRMLRDDTEQKVMTDLRLIDVYALPLVASSESMTRIVICAH